MKPIKNFIHGFAHITGENWKIELLKSWPSIIGNLGDRVFIEKIMDNMLILGVTDSSWMQELYILSVPLMTIINEHLKTPRIKRLRFKNISKKTKTENTINEKKIFVNRMLHLEKKHKTVLNNIRDPQIKSALKNYLRRCNETKA